jgi:hypothetical protein
VLQFCLSRLLLSGSEARDEKENCINDPFYRAETKSNEVVNHRPKSYFLERATILSAAGGLKTEIVESAEYILTTSEVIFFPFSLL